MVNHKKSLESKCIPQWRQHYIEYGELNDLLSKAVKQVHQLFEAHAVIIANEKEKKRKKKEAGGMRRRINDSLTKKESEIEHPVIILDELDKHQKFEKQVFFNTIFFLKIYICIFVDMLSFLAALVLIQFWLCVCFPPLLYQRSFLTFVFDLSLSIYDYSVDL